MNDARKKYIGEEITVVLPGADLLERTPECPLSFTWREREICVDQLLNQWTDFSRKGKNNRNMREEHLQRAAVRGSWGVGRFYFEVCDADGVVYTLYYDRSPASSSDRKGTWILLTVT